MSGVKVAEHGLVGAMGVATKDVPPFNVVAGVPAKTVKVKTIAPADRVIGSSGDRVK
jgi:acetyltransferase-like isoleucine patch superfamily enzyme